MALFPRHQKLLPRKSKFSFSISDDNAPSQFNIFSNLDGKLFSTHGVERDRVLLNLRGEKNTVYTIEAVEEDGDFLEGCSALCSNGTGAVLRGGTLFLLPYFIFQSHRNTQAPRITFTLLRRFFLLGLLGKCLVLIFGFTGINYSSPTLAAALGNLIPVFTFLLAIMFGMDKIDIRSSSSNAKSLGTIVAVSGALVMTLYKGPPFMSGTSSPSLPHQLLSQQSNWILGGLLLSIAYIFSATWNILQAATVKDYPEKVTIIFFFTLFGTIQCAVFSLIAERNPSAWTLHPGTQTTATVYSAILGTVRSSVMTWCLHEKGPLYVAMFKPLGMIIAVIMGIMFLGDILHIGSVIGAVIISLGFYTVMWGQAKEKNMVAENDHGFESSTKPATSHRTRFHKEV
ncbi:hypothetical protein F0562_004677 [Nyssa sinensis]|uniref:WAT1-related protein n=1 Tax=Nyssa sinensis TaxID=561372 RepID=A0A5J5C288_9ASTE|nr:hypothetical protein F0562_004677 [Nyssa sinensis]